MSAIAFWVHVGNVNNLSGIKGTQIAENESCGECMDSKIAHLNAAEL